MSETFLSKTPSKFINSKAAKAILLTLLLFSLIFGAFLLRLNTFWLNHWQGDQSHYLSLAMKLEKFGFSGYNLRGLAIRGGSLVEDPNIVVVAFTCVDPDSEGDILRELRLVGYPYYNQPIFWKTPLLPYALMFSHKIFQREDVKMGLPYLILQQSYKQKTAQHLNPKVFKLQFYASVVPLFFNLMTILIVFFLGRKLYSTRVGIYASVFMAATAIPVWIAHKIWTENPLLFFASLSLLIFIYAKEKRNILLSALAGVACGLGILSKQTCALMIIPVAIFSFKSGVSIDDFKGLVKKIFNRELIVFVVFSFLISLPWFITMYRQYGDFLYLPDFQNTVESDLTSWTKIISQRPHPFILYTLGTFYLCPLFALVIFTLGRFFKQAWQFFRGRLFSVNALCLWSWILVFLFYSATLSGREHRYFLPAYPAIAVLSAFVLDRMRYEFSRVTKLALVAELIMIIVLALNSLWSLPIGLEAVLNERLLIRTPF